MKSKQKAKLKAIEEQRQKKNRPSPPTDKVQFFQEVLQLEPYPYQAEFLQDTSALKVIRWCRRAGKTTVMSGDDIYFAMHNDGSRIIVTMPKFDQIKEVYFQSEAGLHAHLERMPRRFYEAFIKQRLETIIRFTNGSTILAETPEPFTIRGHGPSKISISEMNFIKKDKDLWLSALLPMTLTKKVYVNVDSTPWNEDSVYHDMCFNKSFRAFSGNVWHGVKGEEPGPSKFLKTWKDVMQPNGPLDPEQIEIMREQYQGDPWRWRREMCCDFVDDETAFLPSSLIIKCQNEQLNLVPFEETFEGDLYLGWDLGRERDPGAVAVVNKQDDVRSLIHCVAFKLGTPYVSQMSYIKSLCDRWRSIHRVAYDHTGTKGMDEQINLAGFPSVDAVDFTKQSKHAMAMYLKQSMMTPRESDRKLSAEDAQRKFELPYDQDVQAELNSELWEQSPGSEIYTFSHPENCHDDRFWAIALAVYTSRLLPPPHPSPAVATGKVHKID